MEEIIVTGVVLTAMPYREKDKLIHIFSVELGNITAILKGVASPNSKLKYAGQPFCMAKFELARSHEFYTVKGVELIDTFYDISLDYDNYRLSSAMLEICNFLLKPNIISERLFINLVKSLKNIVYSNVNSKVVLIKFLCDLLEIMGYKLNFEVCDFCGMKFMGNIKFNYESGTFRCSTCSSGEGVSSQEFISLKVIAECEIDKLNTLRISESILDKLIVILVKNTESRVNYKFKSINV